MLHEQQMHYQIGKLDIRELSTVCIRFNIVIGAIEMQMFLLNSNCLS